MRLGEQEAIALDAADPLARFRDRFELPTGPDGRSLVYLAGNSLGLMPRAARAYVAQELDDWARLGVEGHFHAKTPWYGYHETLRDPLARLVGALPGEVVAMNSLTVNLHLMLATFYRPTPSRHAILIEEKAFPSDIYAAQSQATLRGLDPASSVLVVPETEVLETLERRGGEIAVVLLSGVQYYGGRLFDIPAITRAARSKGCVVGWDLAHAAGNVPLELHDWNVDFAAWCSYKYLNAGPGAIAGCFVHERHASNVALPRMGGWWGNDPETRFRMHLNETFVPRATADGWQLSNPPILAMAPLRASLEIFDEAGIGPLRSKSLRLTAFLEALLEAVPGSPFEILTPRDPEARGCQLSLRVKDRPRERFAALEAAGVVADFRPPEVIRVAPVPLYNSFHDVWRAAEAIAEVGA
ncbi:MAG TPA: kynureninase [Candidatus Polarisedimenticolaceae bacterium]